MASIDVGRQITTDSGERYWYRLGTDGAVIVKCESSATAIKVPETIEGLKVAEIAEQAFAQMFTLKQVSLPRGMLRIGPGAFKSCITLRKVDLPNTLQSIGSGAFRATALSEIRLPATCTDVLDDSLTLYTSWKTPPSTVRPSSVETISVDAGNPSLCMCGGVLCKRIPGGLKVLMCANPREEVSLTGGITMVVPAAFTGVTRITTVRVTQRLRAAGRDAVFPSTACDMLEIECLDGETMRFPMPSDDIARATLSKLFRASSVDPALAATVFDGALCSTPSDPTLFKAMLERVASGRHLTQRAESVFRSRISSALEDVCLHFGASAHWRGFDQLMDCDFVGEGDIQPLVGVLTDYDDAAAAGYLLQAKRRRFGKAGWDYAL